MRPMKYYACQVAKIVLGLGIVLVALLFILIAACLIAEALTYLLINVLFVRSLAALVAVIAISLVAYVMGDGIFRKYNICQRFR